MIFKQLNEKMRAMGRSLLEKIAADIEMLDENESFIYIELFHHGSPYHIETSPLICRANQWTVSYKVGTSVMKELKASMIEEDVRGVFRALGNTSEGVFV